MRTSTSNRITRIDPGLVGGKARRARVLVVEDDAGLGAALEARLTLAGMHVRTASSGRAALDELTRRRHDVVLLDLGLPDIDGIEALAERLEQGYRDEVVVLTGGSRDDCRLARLAGARRVLQKPSPSWLVVDAVKGLLED